MMTDYENRLFCKFMKIKTLIFEGTNSKDCHEHLHKMGNVEKYSVEFVSF